MIEPQKLGTKTTDKAILYLVASIIKRMKVPAFILALALAGAGSTEAFVSQGTSQRKSAMSLTTTMAPVTGGVEGSTMVPERYARVEIDHPWGTGSTKPHSITRNSPYETKNIIGYGYGGPQTGGHQGSSLLPREYERVDVDAPWGGKNPLHPVELYRPQGVPGYGGQARLPRGAAMMPDGMSMPMLAGMTGGAQGSSLLPPGYSTVSIDNPWGNLNRVSRRSIPRLGGAERPSRRPAPIPEPEPEPIDEEELATAEN